MACPRTTRSACSTATARRSTGSTRCRIAFPEPPGPETAGAPAPELTVVLPCLDEAETLADCIAQAQATLATHDIAGEIVVADNGSTDGSPEIAARMGARVVRVAQKGYGSALAG